MALAHLAADAVHHGVIIPVATHVGFAVGLSIMQFVDRRCFDGGLRQGGQPPERLTGPGIYHAAWSMS